MLRPFEEQKYFWYYFSQLSFFLIYFPPFNDEKIFPLSFSFRSKRKRMYDKRCTASTKLICTFIQWGQLECPLAKRYCNWHTNQYNYLHWMKICGNHIQWQYRHFFWGQFPIRLRKLQLNVLFIAGHSLPSSVVFVQNANSRPYSLVAWIIADTRKQKQWQKPVQLTLVQKVAKVLLSGTEIGPLWWPQGHIRHTHTHTHTHTQTCI